MKNLSKEEILCQLSPFYIAGRKINELINEIIIDKDRIIYIINDNVFTSKFRYKIENLIETVINFEQNIVQTNFLYKLISDEIFSSSNCPKDKKKRIRLKNVKNIISLVSCKGGVGKSTNTVNLAYALSKKYKVGILDADIYGPSIPRMTNLLKPPKLINNLIQPLTSDNIKIISIGSMIEKKTAAIWRGPILSKSLVRLFNETEWGELDYLLIDTPPGTGDVHLTIGEKFIIDGAIIITTPQELAIDEADRMIDMLKKLDIHIIGVIENMSYMLVNDERKYIFGKDGGKILAQKNNLTFLEEIELDQKMTETLDMGRYQDISETIKNKYSNIVKLLERNILT